VSLHLLAARILARVERLVPGELGPGEAGRAVLRLARPTFAAPGDRIVLRRVSPARTLGGGRVLDPLAAPVRRRDAARLEALPDPGADLPAALAAWIDEAGGGGVELAGLAARAALTEGALAAPLGRLLEAGPITAVKGQPPVLLARRHLKAAREQAAALLEAAGGVGVPLAELLSRVLPAGAERLRDAYLEDLRQAGVLREVAGRALAAHLAPLEDPLAAAIERLYREARFDAPSPQEAAARLAANPKAVEGMVGFLVARGRLARVGGKWVLHREILDEVAASLRAWGVESFEVGAFKERFALTRKLAIPVLEWLDSERVTRREGDRRRVLPPRQRG
jgi:selenocysteine-specific elongation factor